MFSAKKLYLFDGSSFIYRAYYALPPLKTKSGFPTGAIFGFLRMFLSFLKEKKPQYVAVVFDSPKKGFRTQLFKEYKSNRKPIADDLKVQIKPIKEILKLLGIPTLEMEGVEADDLIGTLAKKFSQKGWEVIIYTPDKDMFQLLSLKGVKIVNPLTGDEIDKEKVLKKFGIEPWQIPSYLALVGDKVDNIPGVEGVGPKRAVQILKEVGSVENILKNWEKLPLSVRNFLKNTSKEDLKRWFDLVKLKTDIEIPIKEEDLKIKKPEIGKLKEKLLELEMKSILTEVEKLYKSGSLRQKTLF